MGSLSTFDGIVEEIRRVGDRSAPAQYVPLLRRCAVARRDGVADPRLAAEVADYASTLSAHGLSSLAENLRAAVPEVPDVSDVPDAPAPGF